MGNEKEPSLPIQSYMLGITGHIMSKKLEQKFRNFMCHLPHTESIDELRIPDEFREEKRADYLLAGRKVIVELKTLESDPEYKAHEEIDKHKDRDDFPFLYGPQQSSKILKHLPDGEKISARIFYKISRSIEGAFRDADKQIESSKRIFGCPDASGLLVLLNQDIDILSPEVISHRVSQLLTKMDEDDTYSYENVTSTFLIFESFLLPTVAGTKLLPLIIVNGPTFENYHSLNKIYTWLQKSWSSFNGIPFLNGNTQKVKVEDFIRLSQLQEQQNDRIPRYEAWRLNYRKNPYLRSLSDEAVLAHGSRLLNFMTTGLLKKVPFGVMAEYMEGWAHYLEECSFRGLDLKKIPKATN